MDIDLADLQALVPGVRFHELDIPEAAWNIALAWHRDSDRVALVRRFIEAVPPAFGKHHRAARTAR